MIDPRLQTMLNEFLENFSKKANEIEAEKNHGFVDMEFYYFKTLLPEAIAKSDMYQRNNHNHSFSRPIFSSEFDFKLILALFNHSISGFHKDLENLIVNYKLLDMTEEMHITPPKKKVEVKTEDKTDVDFVDGKMKLGTKKVDTTYTTIEFTAQTRNYDKYKIFVHYTDEIMQYIKFSKGKNEILKIDIKESINRDSEEHVFEYNEEVSNFDLGCTRDINELFYVLYYLTKIQLDEIQTPA